MQGIEILNKTEVTSKPTWAWILLIVCVIFGFVAYQFINEILGPTLDNICLITLIVCIVCGIFALVYDEPTGRYEYEVIIDENVSIQEVYEKYNVIEQDGKKWILEDKAGAK